MNNSRAEQSRAEQSRADRAEKSREEQRRAATARAPTIGATPARVDRTAAEPSALVSPSPSDESTLPNYSISRIKLSDANLNKSRPSVE